MIFFNILSQLNLTVFNQPNINKTDVYLFTVKKDSYLKFNIRNL